LDPDWIKRMFTNAEILTMDSETDLSRLIGREVVYSKRGVPMRFKEEKRSVFTKEQIAQNKFYIGSNSIFSKSGGWGHPTIEECTRHAQQMLQMNESLQEVFVVEIVQVVRRKPLEVDVEKV
jgi:hypothetical protein